MTTLALRRSSGLLGLAILATTAFGATERARILRVRQDRTAAPTATREPAPVELRLDQFLAAPSTAPREIFRVEWKPLNYALEAGATLRFLYRQERSQATQQLAIRYPFAVREPRTATFEIAPAAVEAGGRVVAWRAVLEAEGQILAELRSEDGDGRQP